MNRIVPVLLLLAFPALSAGQSDAPIRRPEIRVGDSWTYRATNLLAPGTHEHETRVSFADDKVILAVSTRKSDGKEFDSSWTSEWNAISSYTGFIYRPSTGILRFPLRIGDQHQNMFEVLAPRVSTVLRRATGGTKVIGWETVDVPAGKFRALRVEHENVVQPLDGSSPFPVQATYWYVPDVKRWVRFQLVTPKVTTSEELLQYKLNEN